MSSITAARLMPHQLNSSRTNLRLKASASVSRRHSSSMRLPAAVVVIGTGTGALILWPRHPFADLQDAFGRLITSAHRAGLPEFVNFTLFDFLFNVALFVPLGVLAVRFLPRVLRGFILPALIAATIGMEMTQYYMLAGRTPSLSDVVANSMGASLGWAYALLRKHRRRSTDEAAVGTH